MLTRSRCRRALPDCLELSALLARSRPARHAPLRESQSVHTPKSSTATEKTEKCAAFSRLGKACNLSAWTPAFGLLTGRGRAGSLANAWSPIQLPPDPNRARPGSGTRLPGNGLDGLLPPMFVHSTRCRRRRSERFGRRLYFRQ